MSQSYDKLKAAWDDNPIAVIAVVTGAAIAVAKVVDATTAFRNARTWNKEVNRRTINTIKNSKKSRLTTSNTV